MSKDEWKNKSYKRRNYETIILLANGLMERKGEFDSDLDIKIWLFTKLISVYPKSI